MSIRLDIPYCWAFKFPSRRPLTKLLKDVLEPEVDEKFYLQDDKAKALKFINPGVCYCLDANYYKGTNIDQYLRKRRRQIVTVGDLDIKGNDQVQKDNYVAIIDPQGRKNKKCIPKDYVPTLRAQTHGNPPQVVMVDGTMAIKTANKTGYDLATDGDGIDLAYPDSKTRRGRVGHGVSKTLPTSDSQGVMDGYRIRKLTPLECWRLMGFDDTDFCKAEKVNSNTQLYKQAGNSIVVNVLEAILKELLDGRG